MGLFGVNENRDGINMLKQFVKQEKNVLKPG